ncbi:LysM peptidoglycan-binding domain-containing protein [Psychrobacter sp. ENNN9_III]|uniref:LysM peptidoglycan-binding domain-containing protein n=1 Tax=Psychrobacter sp. ENNN9_III TaxID=1254334 RepID=UPI00071E83FE|nr:LysM peptidoglycan-binding domain-containing protein [Psychrobacter sp. ENNN9_III]
MPNSQKKITAGFILLDANSKLLKNIEYKVTTIANEKEHHLVKGKTNSKGATYEFVKPVNTNICLYVKIGKKDFQKIVCLPLPLTEKNKLKMRARVSAILIDSKLEKHGESPGSIKRKDYQVVKGDTLKGIAKKYNTNVAQLKRLNPKIQSIHKIYEGDWLKVPAQIGDVSKETTEESLSKSKPTKPATLDPKSDSDKPWYDNVLDGVKSTVDKADAMIDRVEESLKQGQQKIIDETIDAVESISDASEKLYDKVFDDKEDTIPSNTNPPHNKGKVDEPKLDVKKETGNNQKGNPTEQVTYDSDTTVYHIYFDGRIERANKQAVGYAAFIYYDENGGKHYLGKTEYLKIKSYGGGGNVYLVNIGGDEKSSKFGGSKINDNSEELSVAEKEKRLSKYRKGNVGYNIFMNSKDYQRYYLSGVAMATFLGALCKLGYDDISFNGASKIDGSPGPSSSHTNGKCIDVRYLRKDKKALEMILDNRSYDSQYDHERNVRLVNIFHEFGWGKRKRADGSIVKMLSVYFTNPKADINKSYILPHCGPYRGHDNHLHLQGLVANIKDIDVISRVPESKTGICSCNTDLTLDQLRKICTVRAKSTLENILPHLNKTLKQYNINTCLRKAHFIAQLAHESAEFLYNEEQGATDAHYGGYKGRGYIQISLKGAYESYGKYVKVNFLGSNNVKMAQLPYSIDSAGWFWTKFKWKDLNELADKNDIIGISAIVNGGFNGFNDRVKYFERGVESLNLKSCANLNSISPNQLTTFNFPDSIVTEMIGESFGWGLWHDPTKNKNGVTKNSVVSKEGYTKFIKLANKKGSFGKSNKRYGWTYDNAVNYAKQRVSKL